MKRIIKAARARSDLWADVMYVYNLIVNEGKDEYADEYNCAYINYELSGGSKGFHSSNKKYRDLYLKLSGLDNVMAAREIKVRSGKWEGISATFLSLAQYQSQKDYLDYQFKHGGYRFYSKPGKDQYTWRWYAVPLK